MNKGYHVANFTLPVYEMYDPCLNRNQFTSFMDSTLITYGYKGTGKSSILKQQVSEYITQQFRNAKATGQMFTYELSAIEIQNGEKIVCLLSGKYKEVAEDRNGYF